MSEHGIKIDLEAANRIAKTIFGERAFVEEEGNIYVGGLNTEHLSKYTYQLAECGLLTLLERMCLERQIDKVRVHHALYDLGLVLVKPANGIVPEKSPSLPTIDPAELDFYERAVIAGIGVESRELGVTETILIVRADRIARELVRHRRSFIAANKPS